jgi:hypothetical protein
MTPPHDIVGTQVALVVVTKQFLSTTTTSIVRMESEGFLQELFLFHSKRDIEHFERLIKSSSNCHQHSSNLSKAPR